ncbi:protease modulator HflC [Marinibactrum halimedae]|uniref:Protein HflC n=1 Tax=Marinibactrum halimedae TaxID=1444977 RepID=A0AA37T825_9GAMM|nr:protease modulator HflC [Marinibactrum halimedae]MCD9457424.1 protease modulator HflC [Marinibactrum halimedae]GLS25526.1 protein HflC [Marinibactrum halimedae]
MNRKIALLLIGIVTLYSLATSIVAVKESEIAIVFEFGRPVRVIDTAGPAFKLPNPIQTVRTLDKRIQLFDIPTGEFGTSDRRNLIVSTFVIWKISDAKTFLTSVRNKEVAEQRLETITTAEIGAAIGATTLDRIFTTEEGDSQVAKIFNDISTAANHIANQELGIEIVAIEPSHIGFPKQNLLAIYKRMESEWEKLAKQYRAEGQEQAAKIRSATEREVRELQAKAYREAQATRGKSEAEAAKIYAEAFQENRQFYEFTRSMEAYEKILNKDTQLILSSELPVFNTLLQPPKTHSLQ